MAEPHPASAPMSSGHVCPACGKAVDSLRAGQVSIVEGRFLYYCDAACKKDHARSSSQPLPSHVETATPPPVGTVGTAEPREAPASARREAAARAATATPAPAATTSTAGTAVAATAATATPAAEGREESSGAPSTLRSIAVRPARASRPDEAPAPRPPAVEPAHEAALTHTDSASEWLHRRDEGPPFGGLGLVFVGVASGALAALVPLLGPRGQGLSLPLAALAAAAALGQGGMSTREPDEASRASVLGPIAGAIAAAAWAVVVRDPGARSLPPAVGLIAVASLLADTLVRRARESAHRQRERIARRLSGDVRVLRGGEPRKVPAEEVKPGEEVVAGAGEVLGVDGVVSAGEARVVPWVGADDEVEKKEGDTVLAGAKLVSGQVRVTATWCGSDRAYARLALSPRLRIDVAAPLSRGVRRALAQAAPAIGAGAGVLAYASGARGPEVLALASAVAFAVGCRGAATAVALHHARGLLSALDAGIVYKDAAAFDAAGRASVCVLCSRGTVLAGEPEVVAVTALGSATEERVLSLAAGAETASNHPIAGAILRAARKRGEQPENVRGTTVHPGMGVTALSAGGDRLVVGGHALLLREKISVALAESRISELESKGRVVVLVALAGKLVGLLALHDRLRAGARAAVQRLLGARLEPVLLSGEARETCEAIGRAIDIDHIRPEVPPGDRAAEVRALGEGGHVVAVVGHPKVDEASLGAADVAVALAVAGGAPGEWTVSLGSDDVRDAVRALTLAKDARERARVALALGLAPGAIGAAGIAWGALPLWASAVAALAGLLAALRHVAETPGSGRA